MGIIARKFNPDDIESAIDIWNEIVEDGIAFPQMEQLDKQAGLDFFLSQSHTGVAIEEGHRQNGRPVHPASQQRRTLPGISAIPVMP